MVTVYYAVVTHKLANTARRQRHDALMPLLEARLTPYPAAPHTAAGFEVVVRNVGTGPALGVRAQVSRSRLRYVQDDRFATPEPDVLIPLGESREFGLLESSLMDLDRQLRANMAREGKRYLSNTEQDASYETWNDRRQAVLEAAGAALLEVTYRDVFGRSFVTKATIEPKESVADGGRIELGPAEYALPSD